ncbi:MAG TPA: methyltransferase domain-containing protein [Mizugakiibacter sp.]|nr:methyltransferase domain-containing protein [Mizugakiibacter sp.]
MATFLRAWMSDPLGVAAVSPSGRQLAGLMIRELPATSGAVVELGAGTGVFTQAMLEAGLAREQLLVLELNPTMHRLLKQRFPGVRTLCADARNLCEIARQQAVAMGSVDAVVSGLGLLSMSPSMRRTILDQVFELLSPVGRFIQFTYGPLSPYPQTLLCRCGLRVQRVGFAWRNVPPASVFVYQRESSDAMA